MIVLRFLILFVTFQLSHHAIANEHATLLLLKELRGVANQKKIDRLLELGSKLSYTTGDLHYSVFDAIADSRVVAPGHLAFIDKIASYPRMEELVNTRSSSEWNGSGYESCSPCSVTPLGRLVSVQSRFNPGFFEPRITRRISAALLSAIEKYVSLGAELDQWQVLRTTSKAVALERGLSKDEWYSKETNITALAKISPRYHMREVLYAGLKDPKSTVQQRPIRIDLILKLVSMGADVNLVNGNGQSALLYANMWHDYYKQVCPSSEFGWKPNVPEFSRQNKLAVNELMLVGARQQGLVFLQTKEEFWDVIASRYCFLGLREEFYKQDAKFVYGSR